MSQTPEQTCRQLGNIIAGEKSCSAQEAGRAVGTVPSALGNRLRTLYFCGKEQRNGQKSRGQRAPSDPSSAGPWVLGLVVVKRAFLVKAKLLSGQSASNWKAGKYNLKALYFYLTPVRRVIVKIPHSNKCWLGWRTLAHCWWECKLV